MPRHRQVPTLERLSLEAIGSVVTTLSPSILAAINIYCEPQLTLQRKLDCLGKILTSHVPFYLYDSMALHVLNAVKALIEKTKKSYFPRICMNMFMTEMNVVVSLTEVVLNQHLKHIDFSQWPKIMRYVLYKNLIKMTGLEVLNLGSCTGGWRTSEHDKFIHQGIMLMKNLRSLCLCFDCTDNVIQILGDNCSNLQSLDVTSSGSVTDRCIPSLLKCTKLQELQLHRTSITVVGYAQLLMGLNRLQDIGRCDEIGNVVRYIHSNFPNMCYFGLKKFQTRDLTTENLRLLVLMCPQMESISLFHDEQFSDLTVLTALDNLKDLKLLSCNFYTDYLKQLLEIKGCNLTSLHLEHVEEIDLNALVSLSKYCPKIKNLVLYNCDFLDQVTPSSNRGHNRYNVKPFENLERIFWVVDCAITHLEFLLMHAINVKFIHLGSSTGITDASMSRILGINPMKKLEELRILYSSDMSLRTIELLIASCPNLRVLSELESWQGLSADELKAFRESIVCNNFDLDVRPTLSYY
ncbi:Ribonuclease P 40kDa (Rpp40) subunit [Popillia japonica]|uniref:Ribonuclease P 40kDa (Rpp40) subunit n=1 Tax=Popillia japonica TaxID=7064 RepID=A0AAW1LW20_POPJA